MKHYTYIVRCSDDTLYTGYTVDIKKRIVSHNSPKQGAKYTRARQPVTLVYKESFKTQKEAMAREAEIKKMTRFNKLLLISKKKKA